ncbi:MAG: peptidoglycan editing factor PgeF [Cyanobacteriota bacterium]
MFKLIKNTNVEYFVSNIFPDNVKHAFTTRIGGNAPPPIDSFSMGTAQYHNAINKVIENRKTICTILGIDYNNLVMTDQHHTDNIIILKSQEQANAKSWLDYTDGVIIPVSRVPAMLFFADCTPVMLYDKENNILALIHAGWKGTAQQIVVKTYEKMRANFNTLPENTIAAIGPNIGICCYEVSNDVAEKLLATIPKNSISDKIIKSINNKPYINLKQINAEQLKACKISEIDISAECTSCNSSLFFSHRLTKGQTGRQSLIAQLE